MHPIRSIIFQVLSKLAEGVLPPVDEQLLRRQILIALVELKQATITELITYISHQHEFLAPATVVRICFQLVNDQWIGIHKDPDNNLSTFLILTSQLETVRTFLNSTQEPS